MIDILLFYLSIIFAFRTGKYLALYTNITIWQLLMFVFALKFFIGSYDIQ